MTKRIYTDKQNNRIWRIVGQDVAVSPKLHTKL